MKKIVSLAFGIAFIGLSFQPLSEASRNAYHAYMASQANVKIIETAERVSKKNITNKTKRYATRQSQARLARNQDSHQNYYLQAKHDTSEEVSNSKESFVITTRAPWKTEFSARVAAVKPTVEVNKFNYVTHSNDSFSLELPRGYESVQDKDHTYLYGKNLEVRVVAFNKNTCNLSFGFTYCAINISKSENRKATGGVGKTTVIGSVVRQSKKNDTVLNNLSVLTDTYTEQFTAYFPDEEVYRLTRYFVRNQDGGVYLVEVKVPQKVAFNYSGLDKRLFDSFRVYGT